MQLIFDDELCVLFPEKSYHLQASTPLDALKLLASQHELAGKIEPVPVRIREIRDLSLMLDPTLQNKKFEVIPVDKQELNVNAYCGAGGNNPLVNIIIGVVIIAVVVVTGGAGAAAGAGVAGGAGTGAAAAASFSWSAFAAQAAMSIGVSLVLTGIMQLLAPKQENDGGNKSSRKFGTQTTTELGTPIQMIFGLHLVYFHLISFNVDSRKYDGVDRPDDSPYFKEKVDDRLPTENLNRFYGVYQAGDETKLLQLDNVVNRTGMEY